MKVRFLKGALSPDDYPQRELPEVAFVGRSNVGKSSLLNCLWGVRRLAYTSSTPGRTRTVNFYLVEDRYYFVDLPGYGYARVPLSMKLRWNKAIESYFGNRKNLKGVVVVMDSRLGPVELDRQMFLWLKHLALPAVPVLTKADKASQKELSMAQKKAEELGFGPPVVFSAKTGQGKDRLWKKLLELLESKGAVPEHPEVTFLETTHV